MQLGIGALYDYEYGIHVHQLSIVNLAPNFVLSIILLVRTTRVPGTGIGNPTTW